VVLALFLIGLFLLLPYFGPMVAHTAVPGKCISRGDPIVARARFVLIGAYTWYDKNVNGLPSWGGYGDYLLTANVDGDDCADMVYWRPSTRTWNILKSSKGYSAPSAVAIPWGGWGESGDVPLVGQFSGLNLGLDDLVVYRHGRWLILRGVNGYDWHFSPFVSPTRNAWVEGNDLKIDPEFWPEYGGLCAGLAHDCWGELPGDIPLLGDVDGDGLSDLVVYRIYEGGGEVHGPGTFYALLSSYLYDPARALIIYGASPLLAGVPQIAEDRPFVADVDMDGKGDFVVWSPSLGAWRMILSSQNYSPEPVKSTMVKLGTSGDTPLVFSLPLCSGVQPEARRPYIAVWSKGTWSLLMGPSFTGPPKTFSWGTSGDVPFLGQAGKDTCIIT
jgi:hypothetical protein